MWGEAPFTDYYEERSKTTILFQQQAFPPNLTEKDEQLNYVAQTTANVYVSLFTAHNNSENIISKLWIRKLKNRA